MHGAFFLEDTLSILINTTLLPILSSVPLHWPSNRLFWFTFISQFFLVHENLSRVPEYKISPNNSLGGKISGKTNKKCKVKLLHGAFFKKTLSILINTTLLPILSSVPYALNWLSSWLFLIYFHHPNFHSSRKPIRYTYLDHRIQHPIPKLRNLLFWNLLTNHIVSDEITNSRACTTWIYFTEITNNR